jgi:hypothetical protein
MEDKSLAKTKRGQHHKFKSFWFVLVNDPKLEQIDSNVRQANSELLSQLTNV